MIIGDKTILVPFEQHNWADMQKWLYDDHYKYYFKNIPELMTPAQLANFPQLMGMNILMIYEKGQYLGSKSLNFTPQAIGFVSWDNVRLLAKTCDFGIVVDKDFAGKGLSTCSVMMLLNYLFNRLGFHKVIASTAQAADETNEKVLAKLGMQFEGINREHFFLDGKWHNEKRWSLLKDEFDLVYSNYMQKKGD